MNQSVTYVESAAASQLRPVVITVIAAKLAVAALLMTTVNLAPVQPPVELAQLR
ncbi:hypothetical protein QO002_003344 [Pararhizobium capsulatum DSM 1112]|uniref:Uncharacterized protein n=1 Tax=Pararhizobium capsulatum DSM 1112 TaxID=1121113 RepID=A0ABU0BSG7_9HYPH|nr:hypothetical protein [Pararhizobium capsulatum]MDQ0321206.1 hypothetical protein [Pararhizobium capsulatum DSM 1112]